MPGEAWTKRDIAEADRLVLEGAQLHEVAAALGRTYRGVAQMRKRRRRNGDSVPPVALSAMTRRDPAMRKEIVCVRWTTEELATVERLIGEGLPLKRIATKIGRTRSALSSLRWRRRQLGEQMPARNRLQRRRRGRTEPAPRPGRAFDFDDTGEL